MFTIKQDAESLAARSAKIKAQALAEGFHKVGIAQAVSLDEERAHLEEWLRRGFHGEMNWMARDRESLLRRTDPRLILPDARAVVSVALNYYTPREHADDPTQGKISRYAWGDDYHDVLGAKLKRLLLWIKEQWTEAEGKVCVDAQPAMDKAWAVRAGLGWVGKHSNLITREYGSWVFLGELVLNLDLEYDTETIEDHCGTCTLCLEACPTDAITEARVVDSTRCISYATIELRQDELPARVAANQQGWLYGCDICQDVCPWNRFEQPTTETAFEPRLDETSLPLLKVLELTLDEHAARFRRSPVKRAKLHGLQRNATALLTRASGNKDSAGKGKN
ncbi:MAG: tRNA epoxyqueuosine(34) reductase QueG [Pyrinomonadaceae bacterium]|nr:tRNA epoxyqueuosine(34) reductase QueG [Pyrinomonadaceae bacterium]